MDLKKKLLCIVLAQNIICSNANTKIFAMIESEPTVIVDSVNKAYENGMTPLMKAVTDLNVDRTRELLAKGVDLNIPTIYSKKYYGKCYIVELIQGKEIYSNIFEFLCDREIAHNETLPKDTSVNSDSEKRNFDHTITDGPKIKEIADIILQHCVKNRIHLTINSRLYDKCDSDFGHHSCYDKTVWDYCGPEKLKSYPDLSFSIVDKSFFYMIGQELFKL